MGRRGRRRDRPRQQRGERGQYREIVKSNELFEQYYKGLGFVPENEWDDFLKTLQSPLPITFRITASKGESSGMKKLIKTEYISDLLKPSGETTKDDPVTCLQWYPDELAWQINSSRNEVRRDSNLERLKNFLLQENESGNISRQEAVSMIPPMLMNIKHHHKVLDMCAAPGSKTAQIIEYLHNTEDGQLPDGFVMANDVDNKRCYLMTHQVKRLLTPCCAVINHDASILPNIRCGDGLKDFVQYDRILCDVPCSGDGTLRKNADIWNKWTPNQGINLHGIQLKILKRGLELLAVGGRLVYSTCSLNPVEDEAVICSMLKRCEGSVELLDVKDEIQGLKYTQGVSSWKLMTKDGKKWFDTYESIPPKSYTHFQPTMFAPPKEESEGYNLNYCMRVLPHLQNTGGFFIAALRKTSHLPWQKPTDNKSEMSQESKPPVDAETTEKGETTADNPDKGNKRPAEEDVNPKPSKQVSRRLHGFKEDPFLFLEETDEMWDPIKKFYGIPDDFPKTQVMHRTETGKRRTLYFVSARLRDIVIKNSDRVKFINLGVKVLGRSPSPIVPDCDFRIAQEGLNLMKTYFTKRCSSVSREDILVLLTKENPFFTDLSEELNKKLREISAGSMIFWYKPSDSETESSCELVICGWKGKTSVRAFLNEKVKYHYLRLMDLKLAEEVMEQKKLKATTKKDKTPKQDGDIVDDDEVGTCDTKDEDELLGTDNNDDINNDDNEEVDEDDVLRMETTENKNSCDEMDSIQENLNKSETIPDGPQDGNSEKT